MQTYKRQSEISIVSGDIIVDEKRSTTRALTAENKNEEWFILFEYFKKHLVEHHTATKSVKDYALMLNISPKHLNIICKSFSGVTAKQYIDTFMVTEIKRALATSDDLVQKISDEFGFDEPTNFVKYFKKHTGQCPAQFRKTICTCHITTQMI
ncbi:helix-turn-helix domain-containing protein [Desulfosediminicola flagellatus]|uniref:helix-turn-helix domain-containing protein n=1 Tax=Desulfosediminicola flagellatus TaxID=2569541 RepID=UPI0010ACB5C0|nr:helix-turn-helix domain-containing protein [Desulfosediminicola flagellatus]